MNNLIKEYQKRLNLPRASFERIDHNDALVAIVYRVFQPTGEQFILKICDRVNDYLREVHFLQHFANSLPVPQIIQCIPPEDGIHGAIFMECIPGSLLRAEDLTDTLAYELGRCLALIHENRLWGYGDPLQKDLYPDPRTYYTLKFEEGLDECGNNLPSDLIEKCRIFYKAHVDLLMSVDGPCIVHRDFRPGNLLVYNGKLQGIIDWAGSRASFAEEDFTSLEHGEWSDNFNNKKAFLEGYASIRLVPDYNRILPFLRVNKAISIVGFVVKSGTWNTSNARLYQYNRSYLERLFT